MPLRVAFTGGSGRVGRAMLRELVKHGHDVLNLDIVTAEGIEVHTVKCDVSDSGQVFSSLNTHMRDGEPFPAEPPRPVDAVIHFAAIPRPMMLSDGETFRVNVMGTHNVVEAACKLGIRKIIIASSIAAYGVTFAQGQIEYSSFPLHEDLAVSPTDPYALSKLVAERIAQSYAGRFGVDIYCLRIGKVVELHEYNGWFEKCVYHPDECATFGWSYTDSRDLGQMCLKGLEVSGLGWQVFNAVNDSITGLTPTATFLRQRFPTIPITRDLDEYEAPVSNWKIRTMLGFREEHHWKLYFVERKDGLVEVEANRQENHSVEYGHGQRFNLLLVDLLPVVVTVADRSSSSTCCVTGVLGAK